MKLLALSVIAVTMFATSTAQASKYVWSKMTIAQTMRVQHRMIVNDWRIITRWRMSRWVQVDENFIKFVDRPKPAYVTYAQNHMKWTQREYRERARAMRRLTHARASPSQMPGIDSCLDTLIRREGGYNPYATNPSSGAYGAPQALPGYKMASAGPDWRTNLATQIRWMIGYVNNNYGGSCNALAHSYAYNWY